MRNIYKDTFTVVAIYVIFGVAWIVLSDWLLLTLRPDLDDFYYFSLVKGLIFVALSAAIIFFTLRFQEKRRERLKKNLDAQTNTLKNYEEMLSLQKSMLHTLIDEAPLPIMLHSENQQILRISKHFRDTTGYGIAEIPTIRAWVERAYTQKREEIYEHILRSYDHKKNTYEGTFTISTKNSERRYWDWYSAYIGRDEQGLRNYVAIAIDITEQKQKEKNLEHLSFHDDLTNLYNRRYYNQILEIYADKKGSGVFLADINGLKLVNDVFGHHEGDKLLREFAQLLREHLPKDSLIARIGGDEFVAVIPKFDSRNIKKTIHSIRSKIKRSASESPFLSAAFGYSKKHDHTTLKQSFRRAENMLYKDKIHEYHQQTRSVVSALLDKLYEHTDETENHLKRLRNLAIQFTRKMPLSPQDKRELYMLVDLHDIGKISIDKDIFNPETSLDIDQREELKRHPEIGYRIANALPRLKNVAYSILTHHENYDGSGYPFGLKEDEIPLAARILRILDDYDELTDADQGGKTKKEALKTLLSKKNSFYDGKLLDTFCEAMKA